MNVILATIFMVNKDYQCNYTDGEHAMMRTLHRNNIGCTLPVINIHGAEKSMEKLNDGIYFNAFIAHFVITLQGRYLCSKIHICTLSKLSVYKL